MQYSDIDHHHFSKVHAKITARHARHQKLVHNTFIGNGRADWDPPTGLPGPIINSGLFLAFSRKQYLLF